MFLLLDSMNFELRNFTKTEKRKCDVSEKPGSLVYLTFALGRLLRRFTRRQGLFVFHSPLVRIPFFASENAVIDLLARRVLTRVQFWFDCTNMVCIYLIKRLVKRIIQPIRLW